MRRYIFIVLGYLLVGLVSKTIIELAGSATGFDLDWWDGWVWGALAMHWFFWGYRKVGNA